MKLHVAFLFFVSLLNGQTTHAPINFFQFNSDKNINTYQNRGNLDFLNNFGKLNLNLKDNYNSITVAGTTPIYRDENIFSFKSNYKYSDKFSPIAELNSFTVKDNYLTTNKTEFKSLSLGAKFVPINWLNTTAQIASRQDLQQGEKDNGIGYIFSANIDSSQEFFLSPSSFFQFEKYDLGKRIILNSNAIASTVNKFAESGLDSFQVKYFSHQSDFYVFSDSTIAARYKVKNNIRSRNENIISFSNFLNYPISNNLYANVKTSFDLRNIGNSYKYFNFKTTSLFPTNVKELKLDGSFQVNYNSTDYLFSSGVGYSERSEEHSVNKVDSVSENIFTQLENHELLLNNTSRKTNLWGSFEKNISESDNIKFQFSTGILRYDTPSNDNLEDRDELTINILAEEKHIFTNNFVMTTTSDLILNHNVYLLKERSANNLWNRILRLGTSFIFIPNEYLYTTNSFDVLANYSVYDFESFRLDVRSYSFRQFRFLDSTIFKINKKFDAVIHLQFREYLRGQFSWHNFSEKPEEFVDEVFFSTNLKYSEEAEAFTVGMKYFQQIRYRYVDNKKFYYDNFLNVGPTIQLSLKTNNFEFLGNAWRDYRFFSGKNISVINDFRLTIKYSW